MKWLVQCWPNIAKIIGPCLDATVPANVMGNSTSLGQGGSESLDKRDMGGDGFKDGRPPEETQLAEEKPLEEPPNSNLPQT